MRILHTLCFLLCLGANPVSAAQDVIAQEQETWTRIATAGQQRMLSQRIEQAACYVMAGLDADTFSVIGSEAADLFQSNLSALTQGGADLNLPPETEPDVLAALSKLNAHWQMFEPAARQVMAGDLHAIPVRQLIVFDLPLLALTEEATHVIKTVYAEKLVARKRMASTINIAARQRMLAIRMAKNYCYITLNLSRDAMIADLLDVMDQFEAALKAMEFGDFDLEVVDPPSLAVMSALMDVRNAWTEYQTLLQVAIDDPAAAEQDLVTVAQGGQNLRVLSNAVLELYSK